VIVRILGSAAGGGVPQWNCACSNCAGARDGAQPRRTQSGAAVSADGKRWLLLNCSPDIGEQIEAFVPLHPREIRDTPIGGMLFTDANVDHIGGLATLRQAGSHRFTIHSSAVVRDIAQRQPAFAPFTQPPHAWSDVPFDQRCEPVADDDVVGHELTVRAIPVPGTTPGYDGRRSVHGAVVAYQIRAHDGKESLLYAPVFADVDDTLLAALHGATVAIVDGSFYADNELTREHLMEKSARALGHLPVGGDDGSLRRIAGIAQRTVFAHLNNSNPMLDVRSKAYADVREAGAEIAFDGMQFRLN
jgi:pyrroloquinoline quinone biosynthesis protein B